MNAQTHFQSISKSSMLEGPSVLGSVSVRSPGRTLPELLAADLQNSEDTRNKTQYKHKLTHRAAVLGQAPVMLRRCGYVIPQQSFRTARSMLAPAEMAKRRRPRDAFIEPLKDRDEDNGSIYKIGFSSALPTRPHSGGTRMWVCTVTGTCYT